ncbi:hypothetical protein I4U23_016241 [Adineta vaga]|nr:hypothetical protein I4U23_016241 [Adineta vaga]
MFNLEALSLYLAVCVNEKFIDGNHLMNDIIDYMPWLNHFSFYIRSVMRLPNQINLPSTKDIQSTFVNFSNHTIISYVDYFQKAEQGQCHIYSYPSFTPYYNLISNNFPDGLFKHVRAISLYDEHPFEHEFFLSISYESLKYVTHNFTRDDTRINCAKINELELFPASQCTNVSGDYFPNANLCFLEQ